MRPPVLTTPTGSLPSTERLGASGLRPSGSPVVSPWAPADMIRSHSLPGSAPSPSPRSGLPPPSSRSPSRRTPGGGAGFDGWRRMALLALPLVLLALAACTRIGNPEGGSGAVVSGDTLYVATRDGELIALDRVSGEKLWGSSWRARRGISPSTATPWCPAIRSTWAATMGPCMPCPPRRGGAWSRRRRTRSASPGTSSGAS